MMMQSYPRAVRPAHVLMIVENLPLPFDRRSWNEACALRDAGYRVSVICPTGPSSPAAYECLEGIEIWRHPLPEAAGKGGYVQEYARALWHETRLAWKVWRRNRFDIIHACNPPDLIFLVALQFKPFGVRFVFDHHDLNPELYEAKFGRRDLPWHLLRTVERLTFATCDMSIATNNSYRQIAIQRGGMDPDRVHVVRSGPNLKRFRPVPANPALRQGRRHLVAYLGVMGRQEGIHYLLEAIRMAVHGQGRTDIHFALIGDGPERATLMRTAQEMGIADWCSFTGRVPDAALLEWLCSADVCVNPDEVNALNDKSTMNKIMEYMAVGRPIVQFETVEGRFSAGEASSYARPNDSASLLEEILALLDDPARREAMGRFGEQRIRQVLAWEYEAPKLVAAYARLSTRGGAAVAEGFQPLAQRRVE